jgi:hypothetical protein
VRVTEQPTEKRRIKEQERERERERGQTKGVCHRLKLNEANGRDLVVDFKNFSNIVLFKVNVSLFFPFFSFFLKGKTRQKCENSC